MTQIDAYKTAFETFTSGGLAADSDLLVTYQPGDVYRFEAMLSYWSAIANTNLGYVMDLNVGTPTDVAKLYVVATTQGGTFNYQPLSVAPGSSLEEYANNPVASTNYGLTLTGLLDASACTVAGTIQAMFEAQNHTQVNVNAGSQIVLTSL